jgi:hypothetical protein
MNPVPITTYVPTLRAPLGSDHHDPTKGANSLTQRTRVSDDQSKPYENETAMNLHRKTDNIRDPRRHNTVICASETSTSHAWRVSTLSDDRQGWRAGICDRINPDYARRITMRLSVFPEQEQ